jgi:hypothetical protein
MNKLTEKKDAILNAITRAISNWLEHPSKQQPFIIEDRKNKTAVRLLQIPFPLPLCTLYGAATYLVWIYK